MLSKRGPSMRQFKTSESSETELKQFIRGGRVPEKNCFKITTLENAISTEDTEKTTKYIK